MLVLGNKLTLNAQKPIYHFVNKYSIVFDGVDDKIITDGADTVLQNTTYSFWSKSSLDTQNTVFGHGSFSIGAFVLNNGGNSPRLRFGTSIVLWNNITQQDDGEWHHWVVYADPNNVNNSKLYCDGVLQIVSTTTAGTPTAYTESLTIGCDQAAAGGSFFTGNIDEFAVFDRELTQEEITRMYNTYYSPNRVANGNFSQIGNEEVENGDFSEVGAEQVTNGDVESGLPTINAINFIGYQSSISQSTEQSLSPTHSMKVTATGNVFTSYIIPNDSTTANKRYLVTYSIYVPSTITGSVSIRAKENGVSRLIQTITQTDQWVNISYYFNALDYTTDRPILIESLSGLTGEFFYIDNVSVKEVGQSWEMNSTAIFTANGINITTGGYIRQDVLTSGKSYQLTYDIISYTSGNIRVYDGTDQGSIPTVLGSNTFNFTAGGTIFYIQSNSVSVNLVIDNISVKEVGQGWNWDSSLTGGAWSTDGTKAICDGSQSGNISFKETSNPLIQGRTYRITYDISNYQAGDINPHFKGTGTGNVSGNGFKTASGVAGSSADGLNMYAGSTFEGDIDNVVVQELKHDATNLMLNAGAYQSANPLITSTNSMEFDGADDYLSVADADNLSFVEKKQTFCAWIYPNDASDYGSILQKPTEYQWYVGTVSIKQRIYIQGGSGSIEANSNTFLEQNKWNYCVVTYDGTNVVFYLNGVADGGGAVSNTITASTNPIFIGENSATTENFDGNITELGMYDRVLTSLEVASLYNQGMPTNLLVNRNDYQSGNPTVFNTKQVDFDGTDDYLIANSTLGSFTGSASIWVKRDDFPYSVRYLLSFRANSGTGYITISYGEEIDVSSGTVYIDGVAGIALPSDTNWHHVFVSGISLNITESINFAKYFDNNLYNLNGKLSQVGIFNSTLTADEVSSLYNHGLPVDLKTNQAAYESSSNLVGYWRMGSGTLDSYPLIADQTNATLGNNLASGYDFTSGWNTFAAGTLIINSTSFSSQSGQGIYAGLGLVANKLYKIKITGTQPSGGYFTLKSGTTGTSLKNISTTSFNEEIFATPTVVTASNNDFYIRLSGHSAGTVITISNLEIQQVNGNPAMMINLGGGADFSDGIQNGSPYANIIQNSDFSDTSFWTVETPEAEISNGKVNFNTTLQNYGIYRNSLLTSSVEYKVVFTIDSYTSGGVHLNVGGTPTNSYTATGTYTAYITGIGTNVFGIQSKSGGAVLSIDNVTVSEVNTGLQGYWKMGSGINDEYPVIYDQTNPTLGSELVVNGDFATDSDWTKQTGWTISGGKANALNSSGSSFYQASSLISGKSYKVSFDITNLSSGSVAYRVNSTEDYIAENGTHTITWLYDGSFNYIYFLGDNFTGSIDNVSVKQVQGNPATMTNMVEGNITNQYPLTKIRNYYRMGDGILDGYPIIQDQTSPNLAHIPTTNQSLYGNDISQIGTITSGDGVISTTGNYAESPDGTQNATRVVASGTSGSFGMVSSTAISSTSGDYVGSIYLKSNNGANQNIAFYGRSATVTYVTITSNWERYTSDCLYATNFINFGSFSSNGSDTSVDFLAWGLQIEHQHQATAYLPSYGITSVRKATTTNLITYSEDFSQSVWNKLAAIIYSNNVISPDGTLNADLFVPTSSGGQVYNGLGTKAASSINYTASLYVKAKGLTSLRIYLHGTSNANRGDATFNLDSESVSFSNNGNFTNTSASILSVGNDWYRCSLSTTSDTSTGLQIVIRYDGTTDSVSGLNIWGTQVEEQTQVETYAPTFGLPVTIDLFTENNYGTMINMTASDIVPDTPNN